MAFLLFLIFIYLVVAIFFYAKKREAYDHFNYTISELGESGSEYEKQVSYFVFFPVGLGCIIVSYFIYDNYYQAAIISGALGFSYLLSAFFPCDPGTPLIGTWKNAIHNIVGGLCYGAMTYQLNILMHNNGGWYFNVSFMLLCGFLIIFLAGFPRFLIGSSQRLAETSIFLSVFFITY